MKSNDFNNKSNKNKSINEWTSGDVIYWLKSLGMEQYVPNFFPKYSTGTTIINEGGCETSVLKGLTDAKLRNDYKIQKKSHRKMILKKLKHIQALHNTIHGTQSERHDHSNLGDKNSNNDNADNHSNNGHEIEGHFNPLSDKKDNNSTTTLYVKGIPYKYHQTCTFCMDDSRIASFHCNICSDFLCVTCDSDVHRHAKRSGHVRYPISKYDSDSAGQVIIHFFRFINERKKLRRRIRMIFERRYDPRTKYHYYLDLRTGDSQWHKPICLGTEEIKPFLTPQEASFKIMGIYKCWVARQVVLNHINEQYVKYYNLEKGIFLYQYIGREIEYLTKPKVVIKSNLAPSQPCRLKPINLCSKDISPVFDASLATLRIQLFMRRCRAKKLAQYRARELHQCLLDVVSGNYFYMNIVTGVKTWNKPFLLRNQRLWDPFQVDLWLTEDVVYYFRRLGFAKFGFTVYVSEFAVDGPLLLSFEKIDFTSMGMLPIHIKKLQINLGASFQNYKCNYTHEDKTLRRRDALRRHHKIINAAKTIQKLARNYLSQQMRNHLCELFELHKKRQEQIQQPPLWWSDIIKMESIDTLGSKNTIRELSQGRILNREFRRKFITQEVLISDDNDFKIKEPKTKL